MRRSAGYQALIYFKHVYEQDRQCQTNYVHRIC